MSNGTAIVWFRRDLRVNANPALEHALGQGCQIVAVYIHAPDEEIPWSPGGASNWWLDGSLRELKRSLANVGVDLVIRIGRTEEVLTRLVNETDAGLVTWNRLYDPTTLERDRQIKKTLGTSIEVKTFGGYLLKEPWTNLKADDSPYRVYTPFSK